MAKYKTLIFLVASALGVRFLFLLRLGMPLPDEVYYIRSAVDLLNGQGLGDFLQSLNRGQPFFPGLIAVLTKTPMESLFFIRFICALTGALTMIPLYFLVVAIAGQRAAFFTAALYAAAPFAIRFSLWAMLHAFFNFSWVVVLFCLIRLILTQRLLWAAAMGVAASVMYQIRVEGAVFFVCILALYVSVGPFNRLKQRFFHAVAASAAFFLTAIPLWIYLHQATGYWQLTWMDSQTTPLQFVEKRQTYYDTLTWGAQYGARFLGVAKTLTRSLSWPVVLFMIAGMVKVIVAAPLKKSLSFPLFFFAGLPFLFYPAFGSDLRFYTPGIVVMLVFFGIGLEWLWGICCKAVKTGRWQNALLGGMAAVILAGFLQGYHSMWVTQKEDRAELKLAGQWLRLESGVNNTLFGFDTRVCFYAGAACGHFIKPDYCRGKLCTDEKLFLEKLKTSQTGWFIEDREIVRRYNPEIIPLLESILSGPSFKKEHQTEQLVIYKVQL